jgi:hypothetical protein
MAINTKQVLADNIIDAKNKIERLFTLQTAYGKMLINEVGDGGEKFSTDLGTVTVTQKTEDRFCGDFVVMFDESAFDKLDKRAKKRLFDKGIIKLEPRKIVGQEPKIQVRLS